jgi:cytochrome P450
MSFGRSEFEDYDLLSHLLGLTADFSPPAPAPQPKALGFVSLARVLLSNPIEAWTAAHFEKPIVAGGLPFARVAVVSDPPSIRRVLLDNAENYQKDWMQRRILSAGLDNGLLTAEGAQWHTQRRTLAPLFSLRTVFGFSGAMHDAAGQLVERLGFHHGAVVDMAAEVTRVTLDVLIRTIFSDGLGDDPEEVRLLMKRYFETIGRIDPLDILGVPPLVPSPGRWRARRQIGSFCAAIDEMIERRRGQFAAANGERAQDDILSLLLGAVDPNTGDRLTHEEVRANVLTFIVAGHETTANCISWSLYLISQAAEWRERVRAEADRELDNSDAGPDRLVVTRAVIDEANRLYPPIAAISRAALGRDRLMDYEIAPGTMIVIAPYVLHRHRALWSRPDAFDPGRFIGAARETIDRFSYLPFGAGPRTCIGAAFALQEATIVVATIMRNFDLTLAPGHRVWPQQKVTLRPNGGLPMKVDRVDR